MSDNNDGSLAEPWKKYVALSKSGLDMRQYPETRFLAFRTRYEALGTPYQRQLEEDYSLLSAIESPETPRGR